LRTGGGEAAAFRPERQGLNEKGEREAVGGGGGAGRALSHRCGGHLVWEKVG